MEPKRTHSLTEFKHAYISPIGLLNFIPEHSDFHLLLAHLLSDSRYVDFYKKKKDRGDTIIIDNGAFEFKKPMNIDQYVDIIEKSGITPDVIVAPDYPFEIWEKTVESTISFCNKAKDVFGSGMEIMGVPQSKSGDWSGWLMGYYAMIDLPEVSTIGMSILGIPNAFKSLTGTSDISTNRTYASALIRSSVWTDQQRLKKHHFLGCGNPREILLMKAMGLATSNDSSTAIWHGRLGLKFDDSAGGLRGGKSTKPVDFFTDVKVLGAPIEEAILHNISTIESWIN